VLAAGPLTAREIATALVARGIGDDVEAIGNAVRAYVPLVQLPPRGVWGKGGRARYATLEEWTGLTVEAESSIDDVVLRYLGAFGPASVMDAQNWSGLTKLAAVFERLRPRLAVFHDPGGRELFDLPDAPRPGGSAPAPVRFLGEYDNVLLGHADRSRIIPEGFPWKAMLAHGRFVNNLLVDGMLRATWWLEDGALAIRPFGALDARDEVEAEARALVAFLGEPREVRFEPPVQRATA
jgi:Winged helix DNA-binding domain